MRPSERRTMSMAKKAIKTPPVEAANSITAAELTALPILTKEQACALLACKPRYLERAIRSGRLRACKPTGKFVRIFRKDVDSFLNQGASIPLEVTP
jgi:excisionase family DNA binding protein